MKVSPILVKFRPYLLLLLFLVLGVLVYAQVSQAINPPKAVGGTVLNSNGSTPADTAITFKAYISTRPTEILTQASTGSAYGSGFYMLEISNFTTAWAAGQTLVIEFTNSVNSEKRTINVVLDNSNPQGANVTLQPKVLQSIAISAPSTSLPVGESLQFTATGTYDDTTTEILTATATWTVENPNPAGAGAIDGTVRGRFNALRQGSAGVKAAVGSISSTATTVTINAFNGTVTVAANPTSIVANGTSTSTISASVKTAGNANVVDGVTVTFVRSAGTGAVAPATATTSNGVATATYTSVTTVGSGTVTATVGAVSGNATVTLTHGPATKITLIASPSTISSSLPFDSTLTATIRDMGDNVVTTGAGATSAVTFAVTAGTAAFGNIKAGETTKTAAAGVATSIVVSAVGTGGVIACTASSNGLTQGTVNVTTAPKILQSILIEIVVGGKVATATPKVGETVQFRATGTYQDPATSAISTEVITNAVTWASSDAAKGTINSTGRFSALAVGATNVTASLGGRTSNAIAMNVQAAAPVVINTTTLPTTIASLGTIDFGAAGIVTGGTSDGFNYTIEAGSPAGGTISTAGLFAAGPTAGVYTIKVTDRTSGASATYSVKEAFTLTPKNWAFLATDPAKTFTIAGAPASSTKYTWDIMETATATTPVTPPGDYGTWSNGREVTTATTLTNNLAPKADVTATKTFFVRVTIADTGLAAAGLDKVTVGPFNIIPVAAYKVTVTNAAGAKLAGANVCVEYPKPTIVCVVATTGEATFNLPDTGGNYAYHVSLANYVTQTKVSNLKVVPVILVPSNLTITGTVQTTLGAPLTGATVTAYLPAAPLVQYEAQTVGAGSAYTINLPTGAATTGWTVVASLANFTSVQKTGVALAGGTVAINFTGADGLAMKGLGAPDVDAGGGTKSLTASGQTTDVEIPTGGLAVNGFIGIAQAPKTLPTSLFTSASPGFVYQVKLTTDQAGTMPLAAADIRRIIITLPIDLGVLKPGDLEKGNYKIYKGTSLANLQAGTVIEIPAANILQTDYVGDGAVGSVTFWTDRLSFFGVGGGSGVTLTNTTSDSRCFIATAAYGSPFEKQVEILRAFRDVYLLPNKLGGLFVETYYSFSPKVAAFITDSETLKAVVRVALLPLVGLSYLLLQFGVLGFFLTFGALLIGTMALVYRRRSRMA